MHNRFIAASAAILLAAAAFTSCGKKVNTVSDAAEIMTSPSTAAPTTAEVTSETTTAATEPPTEPFSVDLEATRGEEIPSSFVIEGFETVMQEPELPTGCEVVSLCQTLNYLGFDIEKTKLADDFMPIDYQGAVTMKQAYIGDPRAKNGFGCSSPVIVQTADKYFASIDSPCYGAELTGEEFDGLYRHIAAGRPVITWITINLVETYPNYKWTAGNGEEMWFDDYQHCVTVYGYDLNEGILYVADPLKGNVTYNIDRFTKIYNIMGKQAVVICGDSSVKGHHVTTEAEKAVVMTTATEKRQQEQNSEQ